MPFGFVQVVNLSERANVKPANHLSGNYKNLLQTHRKRQFAKQSTPTETWDEAQGGTGVTSRLYGV